MNIATNKTYKKYDYVSRYETFPYYYNTQDEKYFYGITSWLNSDVAYVLHTVKTGESFDSIAFDYYGAPVYYWVILDFNRIKDPFMKLEKGMQLKIPAMNGLTFKEI